MASITQASLRVVAATPLGGPLKRLRNSVYKWIPKQTSGFGWIKESDTFHTRFFLHNYWTENYQISEPIAVRIAVHDEAGTRLGEASFDIQPDGVLAIPGADILSRTNVNTPFEGNVIFTLRHRNLRAGLPIQFDQDYEYEQSKMSSVHGLGVFTKRTKNKLPARIAFTETEDHEFFVVVQNTFPFKRDPYECVISADVEVFNHRGERFEPTFSTPPIPACGHYLISLRTEFPGITDFLEGKPGWLRLWSEVPAHRYLSYAINHENESLAVCHLTGDMNAEPDPLILHEELRGLGRGIMNDLPAMTGAGTETEYLLYNDNDNLPHIGINATVYDDLGNQVAALPKPLVIERHGTGKLTLKGILESGGYDLGGKSFSGNVALSIARDSSQPGIPRIYALALRVIENGFEAEVDLAMTIFNINQEHLPHRRRAPTRTKVFSRIREDDEWETSVWINNTSSLEEGYSKTSETKLMVYSPSGQTSLTKVVHIPPYGSQMFSLRDLFPELVDELRQSNGYGFLKVRDVTLWSWAFYFIRNRRTGAMTCDHLYGG